jgi:phage terminase Nu1 subunit (DNA packaging protein)
LTKIKISLTREGAMPIITKSELAKKLGVSKARVSQYVKMGLPVLADGKIDLSAALNWLNKNIVHAKPGEEDAIADGSADPAPGEAGSLIEVKTQKERLQVRLLRQRLARERALLIPRYEAENALAEAGMQVARVFLTMPTWGEEIIAISNSEGAAGVRAFLEKKSAELRTAAADALAAPIG